MYPRLSSIRAFHLSRAYLFKDLSPIKPHQYSRLSHTTSSVHTNVPAPNHHILAPLRRQRLLNKCPGLQCALVSGALRARNATSGERVGAIGWVVSGGPSGRATRPQVSGWAIGSTPVSIEVYRP